MAGFDAVWRALDDTVATGWAPGIVAGVRHRGATHTYATGTLAVDSARPMTVDTPFRIASLSKPVGGVLALLLVADGVFGLDDPVAPWLPELAAPRVLRRPGAALDDTVPAARPITVRDLLTMTFGLGLLLDASPLATAIRERGLAPGPIPPALYPDEYIARLGALPLAHQPGERWLYHVGSDVLSVLLARAGGASLGRLVADRISGPLGLTATDFVAADRSALPMPYLPDDDGGLTAFTDLAEVVGRPPRFESIGAGLLSTVPDYLTFLGALADGFLLPPDLLAAMTSDQLTDSQRAGVTELSGPGRSWGFQVGIDLVRTAPWTAPGRYGWTGGSGTSAFVDPSRELIGVVFTQRAMTRSDEPFDYFWAPVADAVDGADPADPC